MLFRLAQSLESLGKVSTVNAHCDIPCKIYDPSTSLIATLSVIRLMDIIAEAAGKNDTPSIEDQNTIARSIFRKEEEAEKVKHEVRIIWGDYFKSPQMEAFPEIHELAHKIMMKASACKQGTKRSDGEELLDLVNRFAEIFWATKNVETAKKTCPYPPELPTVYPVL